MRRPDRRELEWRHAAGRWMADGSSGTEIEPLAGSAPSRVVAANGSAYRALLERESSFEREPAEAPEERWRAWLLGGVGSAEAAGAAPSRSTGAHRAGRRWERVETDVGPLVVRAERSSVAAARSRTTSSPPASVAPTGRVRRGLVLVVLGVVALGVGLSFAGWHAQPAAWQSPARVRSVVATGTARRPSAAVFDEEV